MLLFLPHAVVELDENTRARESCLLSLFWGEFCLSFAGPHKGFGLRP